MRGALFGPETAAVLWCLFPPACEALASKDMLHAKTFTAAVLWAGWADFA